MITKDLGAVTAYAYAVEGGYTGTEEEFTQLMADLGITVDEFEHFSVSVSTLPAGSSATASYSDGVLSLGIPKGDKGDTGNTGATGATPNLSIGTVETTAEPSVTITGTVDNPVLNFGLVKGDKGDTGEVSEAELTQAFEDFSANGTVANAEQIVTSIRANDQTPYLFRTAGGSVDIGDREYINGIVGGTVAFNQLVANSGSVSVTVPSGHKYFSNIGGTKAIAISNGSAISATGGTDNIIDLTLMFGSTIADYIYSLEQATAGAGVAYFKKLFPKPYYAYNAGELMSAKGLVSHDMVGFNQWDEVAELGTINVTTGQNEADNNRLRSKNYIHVMPNTAYSGIVGSGQYINLFYYDADKNYISYTGVTLNGNNTFTTPSNAAYMRILLQGTYGTTYNHDICINLSWDGSEDGNYEPYQKWSYPLDSDLELRGIPKIENGNLYYDGDVYEADGTVTRKYGIRAYQSGDESLADAVTDGTNTVYKLATPTTESADPYTNPQIVDDFGTEEFVISNTVNVPIPVGHNTDYPVDLKAKLEMAPNSPSQGNGDYIVRQTSGENEYISLSSATVIQNIISRLEALEG